MRNSNRMGQSDFVSNGANQIKPASVNIPYRMAIDYSSAPFALMSPIPLTIVSWCGRIRAFSKRRSSRPVVGQPRGRSGERGYPGVDEPQDVAFRAARNCRESGGRSHELADSRNNRCCGTRARGERTNCRMW
jgi:hypothetical protein